MALRVLGPPVYRGGKAYGKIKAAAEPRTANRMFTLILSNLMVLSDTSQKPLSPLFMAGSEGIISFETTTRHPSAQITVYFLVKVNFVIFELRLPYTFLKKRYFDISSTDSREL